MNFKRYHVSRNLFDIEKWLTDRGVSYTIVDGKYEFNTDISLNNNVYYFATDNISVSISGLIEAVTVTSPFITLVNKYGGNVKTTALSPTTIKSENILCAGLKFNWNTGGKVRLSNIMLNEGSTALPYEPYGNTWNDVPHYIHNTSTDTLTTLPAIIYPNDTSVTVGLKGQMEQLGTPTPTSPIQPQECGDLETTGEHTGQYKILILNNSQTTNVYLGEVETTRKVKKLVLDGTEEWTYITGGKHWMSVTGYQKSGLMCICSHYVAVENGSGSSFVANGQVGFYSTTNDRLIFCDTNYTTTEDWKTYLAQQYAAGTPVCFWYVLATPETAVVNEPIRKIGDYADEVSGISIPTIAGANAIDVLTTLKPSEVSVNYHGWHPVQSVHERENGAWT